LALKQSDVPFALGGSFAAHARGGPRPTHDVDFFIRPEDRDRASAALRAVGLRVEQPALDWLFKAFDEEELADLIYAPMGTPVGMNLLGRADELDVAALRMPVLDPASAELAVQVTVRRAEVFLAGPGSDEDHRAEICRVVRDAAPGMRVHDEMDTVSTEAPVRREELA